ncbi:short subunit dehydrogenase [Humibacillus xanthopallidus]|uniref:Short subunit dehydrogenase n=1 Tax=Humibacillus xanthopallidus TaxID=412689 RepID=A0A543PK44_9MICO|nr:SDR family oxidoreductase [Humibacillus xanthopallidus]TQN44446.1 short subunit dehydrogenase [Humibacillus xanthopallidus]
MSRYAVRPGQRVVVVTGATGATGRATCAALLAHGERVVAVGRDPESLRELSEALTGGPDADGDAADRLDARVCDLLDGDAVRALAEEVVTAYGSVDGLFHLVGGWRGGTSFTASTDDDWRWLSGNLVDTLRHATLALHDALLASGHGRVAIISAAAAATPAAGNAAYASAKAAAETWLRSMADSFAGDDATPGSAAVIGVVKWIGSGRTATAPAEVADWLVGLLDTDAAPLNGARIDL